MKKKISSYYLLIPDVQVMIHYIHFLNNLSYMLCYVVFAWSTSDETIEEIGMDNASKTDFETRSNKTLDDDEESCLEIKDGIAVIYHKDFNNHQPCTFEN